jgi:LytR cell envelope-related transcriptional attenuator
MSAVNLGVWRIVILVALVISGAVILSNGFADVQVSATPTASEPGPTGTSPTSTPTETPAPPPEGRVDGVTFAVFNGTEEIGFAGQVTIDLEDAGYSAAQDAGDAPTTGVRRTIVYFRGGPDAAQNRADAELLADTHLPDARIARLNPSFGDLVPEDTELVIVLGQDQVPE